LRIYDLKFFEDGRLKNGQWQLAELITKHAKVHFVQIFIDACNFDQRNNVVWNMLGETKQLRIARRYSARSRM
jgi:hypothetical protein